MRRAYLAKRNEPAADGHAADSHTIDNILNHDCLSCVIRDATQTTTTPGVPPHMEETQQRRHFPNVDDGKDLTGTERGPKSGHRVESLQSLTSCAYERHPAYERAQGKGSAKTASWRRTFEGPHRTSRYVPWGRVYLCSLCGSSFVLKRSLLALLENHYRKDKRPRTA